MRLLCCEISWLWSLCCEASLLWDLIVMKILWNLFAPRSLWCGTAAAQKRGHLTLQLYLTIRRYIFVLHMMIIKHKQQKTFQFLAFCDYLLLPAKLLIFVVLSHVICVLFSKVVFRTCGQIKLSIVALNLLVGNPRKNLPTLVLNFGRVMVCFRLLWFLAVSKQCQLPLAYTLSRICHWYLICTEKLRFAPLRELKWDANTERSQNEGNILKRFQSTPMVLFGDVNAGVSSSFMPVTSPHCIPIRLTAPCGSKSLSDFHLVCLGFLCLLQTSTQWPKLIRMTSYTNA